jgi:glucokinase
MLLGMREPANERVLRALVADIGGTKIDLAIFEAKRSRNQPLTPTSSSALRSARYASEQQSSLEETVTRFLGETRIDVAVLGVAGPIEHEHQRCQLTNLPWLIDRFAMQRLLHAPVELINDFAALGYAVPLLGPGDLLSLSQGQRRPLGPIAVIGAGTGLGQAVGLYAGETLHVLAGEGGHADFAPRDEREVRLWRYLKARHGRVSVEHLLSGRGISSLYAFMSMEAGGGDPDQPDTALQAAEVTQRALDPHTTDRVAVDTLALWLSLYGAEAGNLALRVLPEGGLFIAGGIAQKLGARLLGGELIQAFRDKGRMQHVAERTPVDVILRADAALLGAWARAVVVYSDHNAHARARLP